MLLNCKTLVPYACNNITGRQAGSSLDAGHGSGCWEEQLGKAQRQLQLASLLDLDVYLLKKMYVSGSMAKLVFIILLMTVVSLGSLRDPGSFFSSPFSPN